MTPRCRRVAVLAAAVPILSLFVSLSMTGTGVAAPSPSGRVVVIDSPGAPATARHCLTLIREELVSGGFEVSLVDPGPGLDPISIGALMQRQEGAVAAVALVGEPGRAGAELWILDRMGATPEIRRIPALSEDRERLPEILAIRTVELLRASAIRLAVEAGRAAPRAPVPPSVPPSAPPSEPVRAAASAGKPRAVPPPEAGGALLGIDVGLSVFENVGKLGPAALPLGRLRVALGDRLSGRLTMAGLGSRPRVDSDQGSASISQVLALAEVAIAFRPGSRIRPTLSVGGGMLYLESAGTGIAPFQGVRQTRFTAAVDAGVGILARARSNVSFAFEINGVLASPHPIIRFYQTEVAAVAFPGVLASLTMVVWL